MASGSLHGLPASVLNLRTSVSFGAPIDITNRDAAGEADEDWADRLQVEDLARGSPAVPEGEPVVSNSSAAPQSKGHAGKPGKRKLAELQNAAQSLPPPDSTTLAQAPILVPVSNVPPTPGFYLTRGHPMNKQNYRYIPCGPAPDSSPVCPLFRVIPSPPANCVRFAWEDRSPYVGISKDGLAITADKGFRSARGNVPMREGTWYFEFLIERGGGEVGHWQGGGAHVRVGVGRRESPLTAPVGFDGYSYGIRDKTGEAVTHSVTKAYGPPFGSGDTIGILLTLPPRRAADPHDSEDPAHLRRKRVPIRFKGQLYFESHDYPATREMAEVQDALTNRGAKKPAPKVKAAAPGTRRAPVFVPPPLRPMSRLPGSHVEFFRNGQPLGVAFETLWDYLPLRAHPRKKEPAPGTDAARENHFDDGTLGYYPFASCFGGGAVRLVPGPDFAFPPPQNVARSWRPLCDRYNEYMAETLALDELDEAALRTTITAEQAAVANRQRKATTLEATTEQAASPSSVDVSRRSLPNFIRVHQLDPALVMLAARSGTCLLFGAPRVALASKRWVTGAPGQVTPVEKSSEISGATAIRLPDPAPDEPEPPIIIPSILPPEERTDGDSSYYAFMLHPRTVHIVSPHSDQDGSTSDPARVAHLPSEVAVADASTPTEEPDRGPGNPRTQQEVRGGAEEAVGVTHKTTSKVSAARSPSGKDHAFKSVSRDLNQQERSGLLVLLGILGFGWLLGGLAESGRTRRRSHPHAGS